MADEIDGGIIMATFDGVYSCGHEGRISIPGPRKMGEYRASMMFDGLCTECQNAADEKHVDELREKYSSPDAELPMLEGSIKQIVWAERIRSEHIAQIDSLMPEIDALEECQKKIILIALQKVSTIKSARYWIDNRSSSMRMLSVEYYKEHKDTIDAEVDQRDGASHAATVLEAAPKSIRTPVVASISYDEQAVRVTSAKDNVIRFVVKDYGMSWDGEAWIMNLNSTTGAAFDRAAEIGNLLLNAGVSISVSNKELLHASVDGVFEPRHENWVLRRKDELRLVFPRNDEIYFSARKLPGAHYLSGVGMLVPADSVDEMMDFAQRMDFKITPKAQELLDEAARRKHSRIVVSPATAPEKKTEKEELEEILASSREVLPDLKDD